MAPVNINQTSMTSKELKAKKGADQRLKQAQRAAGRRGLPPFPLRRFCPTFNRCGTTGHSSEGNADILFWMEPADRRLDGLRCILGPRSVANLEDDLRKLALLERPHTSAIERD